MRPIRSFRSRMPILQPRSQIKAAIPLKKVINTPLKSSLPSAKISKIPEKKPSPQMAAVTSTKNPTSAKSSSPETEKSTKVEEATKQKPKKIEEVKPSTSRKKPKDAFISKDFECCYRQISSNIIATRKKNYMWPVHFPIFSIAWLPAQFDPKEYNATDFQSNQHIPTRHILVGGGGGHEGCGIGSGILACCVKIDNIIEVSAMPKKKRRIAEYDLIQPYGEIDTGQWLAYKMEFHPIRQEVVIAVGGRVFCFKVSISSKGVSFLQIRSVQADFHPDPAIQQITAIRFNPSGTLLACGGEGKCVTLWKYPSLEKVVELGRHQDQISGLDFTADGKHLASCAGKSNIKIWSVPESRENDDAHGQYLKKELKFDGKRVMCKRCRFARGRINRKKLEKESLLITLNETLRGPGYLVKYDVQTWKMLKKIKVDRRPISTLAISHSREIAVLGASTTIYVYEVGSFNLLLTRRNCGSMSPTSLAFSPDDQFLASGS